MLAARWAFDFWLLAFSLHMNDILKNKISQIQDIPLVSLETFNDKHNMSLQLSESYKRLSDLGYVAFNGRSIYVKYCGTDLTFAEDLEGNKKLLYANFCKDRLCPMCNWRRSRKIYSNVSKVMDFMTDFSFVFATFTVKSCTGDQLPIVVDDMLKSFTTMIHKSKRLSVFLGFFRALEITYSFDTGLYHPHIHVIFSVLKSYYQGKYYIKTEEIVQLWRKYMRIDYDPICYLEKVKGDLKKSVCEIAKYSVKSADYLDRDDVVRNLFFALKGRRLCAFGGNFKRISMQLKLDDFENLNLNDDISIRSDVSYLITNYKWSIGAGGYVLEKEENIKGSDI